MPISLPLHGLVPISHFQDRDYSCSPLSEPIPHQSPIALVFDVVNRPSLLSPLQFFDSYVLGYGNSSNPLSWFCGMVKRIWYLMHKLVTLNLDSNYERKLLQCKKPLIHKWALKHVLEHSRSSLVWILKTFQWSEQRPFPRGLDKYSCSKDSGRLGLVCECCVKGWQKRFVLFQVCRWRHISWWKRNVTRHLNQISHWSLFQYFGFITFAIIMCRLVERCAFLVFKCVSCLHELHSSMTTQVKGFPFTRGEPTDNQRSINSH